MAKLSEMFQMTPMKSTVDVPCELNPGDASKSYVHFRFAKTVMAQTPDGVRPVEAKVELRVGKRAFQEFAYEVMKTAQEINKD